MNRTAEPVRAVSVVEQVEHPALHRDVERAGGLVGDHQGRFEGERDADQHALPHAAGQLVRVLPGARLGVAQPDRPQDLDRLLRAAARRTRPWMRSTSATWSPIRVTGLSAMPGSCGTSPIRAPRTCCHALAGRPTSSPSCSRTLPPTTRPAAGQQADHRVRGRRLAGAGLADERDDLAGVHVEADTPRTAWTAAAAAMASYSTTRSRTCRTGRRALIGAPSLRGARPSRLAARTRAAMTRPGRVVNHQATAR